MGVGEQGHAENYHRGWAFALSTVTRQGYGKADFIGSQHGMALQMRGCAQGHADNVGQGTKRLVDSPDSP